MEMEASDTEHDDGDVDEVESDEELSAEFMEYMRITLQHREERKLCCTTYYTLTHNQKYGHFT